MITTNLSPSPAIVKFERLLEQRLPLDYSNQKKDKPVATSKPARALPVQTIAPDKKEVKAEKNTAEKTSFKNWCMPIGPGGYIKPSKHNLL